MSAKCTTISHIKYTTLLVNEYSYTHTVYINIHVEFIFIRCVTHERFDVNERFSNNVILVILLGGRSG